MTSENVDIRNYNSETDYLRVREILEEGDLYYGPTDSSERLAEKVRRDPESIIVATLGNQIVGTVTIAEDGRMPFIFRLAVKEEYRRRGFGVKLMEEAEKRLKNRGYEEVHIFVNETDEELKEYYRKQAYQEGNAYRWMSKEMN